MNIVLMSHYFPPEIGPGQSRAYEYAERLAARGHKVTVLTCFPNYPYGRIPTEYKWRLLSVERIDAIKVVRTFVLSLPNAGFVRRLANQLSFAASALLALPVLGKVDVVDVISPPLFLGFSAYLISTLKRSKFVLEVLDLWPESAIDLGQLRNRTLIRLSKWLAVFLYRHSDAITVSSPQQGVAVQEQGTPAEKVHFLPNSVDTDFFSTGDAGYLCSVEPELKGKFVVLYLGNLGWAQGLDVLLRAAARMRDTPNVAFVLMGEGGAKGRLVETARELQLPNVLFMKSVPREAVPHVLKSAHICVAALHIGKVFRGVLPTKILEYMAAGKPVVASVAGDAAEVICRPNAGLVCEPGDPAALSIALKSLLACPTEAEEMGRRGSRFIRENYSRECMVARLENVLTGLHMQRHLRGHAQAAS